PRSLLFPIFVRRRLPNSLKSWPQAERFCRPMAPVNATAGYRISLFAMEKFHGPKGELSSMRNAESCHGSDCSRPVVVTFRAEALCLDHFCTRCYEFLDGIDGRQQWNQVAPGSAVEHVLIAD